MSNTEQHIESNHSSFKDIMPLSFGEEVGNTVTHGFASFCTMVILPYAAVHSFNKHGALLSTSISIFVISLFLMFISSTVYHAMANHTVQKYVLRIIDHSMIYVAISGTYTPILLNVVGGWLGWTVFILLWGTTVWGILYKSIATHVNHKLSLIVYLVMGWVGVIFAPIIILRTSWLLILFIVLGGLSYTIGAWFYAQKNRPYFHMIWHIFILIASFFHLIGILFFMS
ncbi:hemolysin III family protein [Staphylococcus warneri]|uniref:PAQR family membrane homeostasis protein TrhA n=1 Tax=Staphylococcus warneri TaxID=1292 RepID=UPI001AEDE942|nr:hemolysin III family protein [Staphylococcus warneri]MBP3033321.1 hemolysin III family protein [Staphylococcus warneri]